MQSDSRRKWHLVYRGQSELFEALFRPRHVVRNTLFLIMAFGCLNSSDAGIVLFDGLDSGSGPGGSQTNTNAAATAFSNASTAMGTLSTINFESLSPIDMTGRTTVLAPGVRVEHFAPFGYAIGGDSARILNAFINPNTGFNTTPGGSNFIYWTTTPSSAFSGAALMRFTFDEGIQGFGARFTNWGTNSGATSTLSYRFNDGTAQSLNIARSGDAGGIQFSGFTDAGAMITSMDIFFLAGPANRGGELFGVDDILIARLSSVPEPSSLLLTGLLGIQISLVRRRSRSRNS